MLQRRPSETSPNAQDRAGRASDLVNISTYAGEDNDRCAGARVRDALVLAVGVMLDWLAYFLRRRGDRLFAMNDTEAYWRGWQITKAHGGLRRRYRDLRFDALTEGTGPEEPAWPAGLGNHRPFG